MQPILPVSLGMLPHEVHMVSEVLTSGTPSHAHLVGRGSRVGRLAFRPLGTREAYLIRMMTEGVCAMAPIMLQTHITHRKVRKASWHPGLGHFPGTTVAFLGGTVVRHAQPVRL